MVVHAAVEGPSAGALEVAGEGDERATALGALRDAAEEVLGTAVKGSPAAGAEEATLEEHAAHVIAECVVDVG